MGKSAKIKVKSKLNVVPKRFDCPVCGQREGCKVVLRNQQGTHEVSCYQCRTRWNAPHFERHHEVLDVWAMFTDQVHDQGKIEEQNGRSLQLHHLPESNSGVATEAFRDGHKAWTEEGGYVPTAEIGGGVEEEDDEDDFLTAYETTRTTNDDGSDEFDDALQPGRTLVRADSDEPQKPFHRSAHDVNKQDAYETLVPRDELLAKATSFELLGKSEEARLDVTSEEADDIRTEAP